MIKYERCQAYSPESGVVCEAAKTVLALPVAHVRHAGHGALQGDQRHEL